MRLGNASGSRRSAGALRAAIRFQPAAQTLDLGGIPDGVTSRTMRQLGCPLQTAAAHHVGARTEVSHVGARVFGQNEQIRRLPRPATSPRGAVDRRAAVTARVVGRLPSAQRS
jgi:hypothetical protein